MSYISELQDVIKRLHGVESKHLESVSVKEEFEGKTVWEGVVEVFELIGHPKARKVYAWSHDADGRKKRHFAVLHLAPVDSFRSSDLPKKTKVGRPKLPNGTAKGRIVPVRFAPEAIKAVEAAAKANKQTVSEWIRSTLDAAIRA